MAARNNGIYSNVISYGCVRYFTANLNDFTDKFMADDTGIGCKGIFPMEDMDIRATDTGSFHFYQYLGFRNFRYIPFDNGNTARFFNYNCFHDISSFV